MEHNYEIKSLVAAGCSIGGGIEPKSGKYAIRVTFADGTVLPQLVYPSETTKHIVDAATFKADRDKMLIQVYPSISTPGAVAFRYILKGGFIKDEGLEK